MDLLAALRVESARTQALLGAAPARVGVLAPRVARTGDAAVYTDRALMPEGEDEPGTLDLLTRTTGAAAAVAHRRKIEALARGARSA